MISRKYTDWGKVFLDTTTVICLLRARLDNKVPRCNFVAKLIDDLTTKKSSSNKDRVFYISAITISELLNNATKSSNIESIVKALGSDNVVFRSYDDKIADFMVKNYHSHLGKDNLTDIAREFSWPENKLGIARQWLEKDLMIIASAAYEQCDTIITLDKNTMLPLAEKADYYCCVAEEGNFQLSQNGDTIFNYNKPTLQKKKKTTKPSSSISQQQPS